MHSFNNLTKYSTSCLGYEFLSYLKTLDVRDVEYWVKLIEQLAIKGASNAKIERKQRIGQENLKNLQGKWWKWLIINFKLTRCKIM